MSSERSRRLHEDHEDERNRAHQLAKLVAEHEANVRERERTHERRHLGELFAPIGDVDPTGFSDGLI